MLRSLDEMEAIGLVAKAFVPLQPGQQPQRILYVSPDFVQWLKALPVVAARRTLLSERAEVLTILADFVSGKKMAGFINNVDPPAGEGVLRLKTTSFRIYGWCPAPMTLLIHCAQRKDDIRKKLCPSDANTGRAVAADRKAWGSNVILGGWYDLFRI